MKGSGIINILIAVFGILIIYNIIDFIYFKFNYKKSLSKIIKNIDVGYKYINKNKKVNFFFNKFNNIFNLNIGKYIILSMLIIFIVSYIYIYRKLHIFIGTFVISIGISLIPYYIVMFIEKDRKRKIVNLFPNLLINLKSYCIVKNDIIEAFRRVIVEKPLQSYIDKFNYSINAGVSVSECFENLKKDINIEMLNNYITLIEYCYLNGGNFSLLLDKMSKMQLNINIKKEKEIQNNFSTKIMLILIVIINFIVVKVFIFDSYKYFNTITNTLFGKIILDINIITYLLIMFIYFKINKMED